MDSLLQIRDVPEDARRELKARAAARGESLNSYLLGLLAREVSRPTISEVLERAARRAEHGVIPAAQVLRETRADRDDELQHRRGA